MFFVGLFIGVSVASLYFHLRTDNPRVDLQKNAKTIDFSHLVPSNTGRSFSVKRKRDVKVNDDLAAWKKEIEH